MFGLRGLAAKIFGTTNDRKVTKYKPRVDEINALEPTLAALSDAELRARTQTFKDELAAGKTSTTSSSRPSQRCAKLQSVPWVYAISTFS